MSKSTIRIDRTKETIAVSRTFQIAAGNIGSAEYQEFLRMREQYPGFQIIVQQKSRKKADGIFGDLTYEGMMSFIKGYETTKEGYEAALAELNDMRCLYKGQRGAYLKVKEWFLSKYQEEFDRRKEEKIATARQKREENYLYRPATANN